MADQSQTSVVLTVNNYIPICAILTSAVATVLNERGMHLDNEVLDTIIVNKLLLKAQELEKENSK